MTPAVPVPRASPLLARFLRLAAGAVLLALMVWAPLNFGSTRSGGPETLATGCFVGAALWLLSLASGAPRPALPRVVIFGAILVGLATLPWLSGFVSPTPVAPFTQAHFARVEARWPVSIVWRTSDNITALTLGFAVALLPLADLARDPRWALAFVVTLVATAVVVALLALAQNRTHATGIYWRNDGRMPGNFCGTFFHHTSAGAYFNTAWPLACALATLAWRRPAGARFRALLIGAAALAVIILLAAHTSHVSRFPQIAALLVLPFLAIALHWRVTRRGLAFLATSALIVAALVVGAGRTGDIAQRWNLFFTPPPSHAPAAAPATSTEADWPALMRDDLFVPDGRDGHGFGLGARGEGWRTAFRAIAARPFAGHGPANWMGAASQHSRDPFVRTFFQFLQFTHQDALQFAVEWGVPAALAWWAILLGAIVSTARTRRASSIPSRALGVAAACALAAVLLQAQLDFPLQIPAVAFNTVVLAALAWATVSGVRKLPSLSPSFSPHEHAHSAR